MSFWQTGEYRKYRVFIRETEKRYGIPENMLAIILHQASKYETAHIKGDGRHNIGVLGIANLSMQDCRILWAGTDNRRNPMASIAGAARLLFMQYEHFRDWKDALLAYHSSAACVAANKRQHEPLPFKATKYVEQTRVYCHI